MVEPIVVQVRSREQTMALARTLAGLVRGGDLLVLAGGLGVGKTTFTQAFADALGIDQPVTSPTFTLANRYDGALTMHHLDAYRVTEPAEVIDLGLEELIDPGSVTVIEWGDTIASALPPERLEVELTRPEPAATGDDEHRIVTVRPLGGSWRERLRNVTLGNGPAPSGPTC